MVEKSAATHDERRNLRPLILGICFAWGLFMGFLINFFRADEVEIKIIPENQQISANSNNKQLADSDNSRRTAGLPAIASVDTAPSVAATENMGSRKTLEQMPPEAPAVNLNIEFGLTGKTAAVVQEKAEKTESTGNIPFKKPPLIIDLDPY